MEHSDMVPDLRHARHCRAVWGCWLAYASQGYLHRRLGACGFQSAKAGRDPCRDPVRVHEMPHTGFPCL